MLHVLQVPPIELDKLILLIQICIKLYCKIITSLNFTPPPSLEEQIMFGFQRRYYVYTIVWLSCATF